MSAGTGDPDRTVRPAEDDDVMAAVDRGPGGPTYVIADVSTDDAWLATPDAEALPLAAWR